jgi:hypothetical protein
MEAILRRDRQTGWVRGLAGGVALCVALTIAVPSGALAQCSTGDSCTIVRPDGKGIIGLGLIGAELGLIIPAIAGIRDEWWPYLVFPLIGAVGGGIGGYFVEQATQPFDAEVDVALMAIGMVLIVPTIVGTLALTAYQPPTEASDSDEDYEPEDISTSEDSVEATHDESAPTDAAPAEGGSEFDESGSTSSTTSLREGSRREGSREDAASRMRAMMAGGRGIVRFVLGESGGDRMSLAVPMIYSASSYTAEERARMLLNPQSDLIVPVVSATF